VALTWIYVDSRAGATSKAEETPHHDGLGSNSTVLRLIAHDRFTFVRGFDMHMQLPYGMDGK
jgi:hypothetical protein